MNLAGEFQQGLREMSERLGITLKANAEEVRAYIAVEMLAMADVVGEPGYAEVLAASGLNVAMFAMEEAIESADQVDREFVGQIIGGIGLAARLIAGGAAA